jgi:hypothetical protein
MIILNSLPTTVVDLEKIDPSFAGIWKQIDVYSPSEGYLATQTKGIYLRDAYLEKRVSTVTPAITSNSRSLACPTRPKIKPSS